MTSVDPRLSTAVHVPAARRGGTTPAPELTEVTVARASEVELFSLLGEDGYLREVNAAFARLLGLTVLEAGRRSLLELVHPEDLPAVVGALAAMASGDTEVLVENRFLQVGGGTVHLQWVVRALPHTDVWWACGRDTTAFHRLLGRANDTRARLDLALGSATAALWELDLRRDALLLTWEPQAAAMLGVEHDAVPETAAQLAALAHPDDAASVLAALSGLGTAGTTEVALRVGGHADRRHLSLRGRVLDRDRRGRAVRAVGLVLDVTAEKAMEEQMLRMVMSDALTGVPNRRAFDQALRSQWRRCTRALEPLSVVMVDIDDFKRFNDTFGHLVGDAALCGVARALNEVLHRTGDLLARFGGEEFALVLPGADPDGARVVAERLVGAVRGVQLRQAPDWRMTVSVGSATWLPGTPSGRSADLLSRADAALYTAKAGGKDRHVSA